MAYIINKLLILPGIIIGLTLHEFAHAKVASICGDDTAKNQGRVSLNPIRHFDWVGLACLVFVGFGWGKPVPVNPFNLTGKNQKLKQVSISAAGVIMNFFVALIAAIILNIMLQFGFRYFADSVSQQNVFMIFYDIVYYTVYINVVLMIFNLLPIPPLDGFNIVAELTSFNETELYYKLLQYGFFILIILLITNIINYVLTPGIDMTLRVINGITGLIF